MYDVHKILGVWAPFPPLFESILFIVKFGVFHDPLPFCLDVIRKWKFTHVRPFGCCCAAEIQPHFPVNQLSKQPQHCLTCIIFQCLDVIYGGLKFEKVPEMIRAQFPR